MVTISVDGFDRVDGMVSFVIVNVVMVDDIWVVDLRVDIFVVKVTTIVVVDVTAGGVVGVVVVVVVVGVVVRVSNVVVVDVWVSVRSVGRQQFIRVFTIHRYIIMMIHNFCHTGQSRQKPQRPVGITV